MGLLDNIFRLSSRAKGSINFDLTTTGQLLSFNNSAGYDELILNVTISVTGEGMTRTFRSAIKDSERATTIPGIRDAEGNSLDYNEESLTYYREFDAVNLSLPMNTAFVVKKRIIVPITGINTILWRCDGAALVGGGGSCTIVGTYEAKQGITPCQNNVQLLRTFSFSGDGTTKEFGGSATGMIIPKNAKFVFASVSYVSGGVFYPTSGNIKFAVRSLPPVGDTLAAIDWVNLSYGEETFSDSATYSTKWKEVIGSIVRPIVTFDAAPSNEDNIIIKLFVVL